MTNDDVRALSARVIQQAVIDLSDSYRATRRGEPPAGTEKYYKYNQAISLIAELETWFEKGEFAWFTEALGIEADGKKIVRLIKSGKLDRKSFKYL